MRPAAGLTDLPCADGYVATAAHPGRPDVLTAWMDASVVDENDAVTSDPELDLFVYFASNRVHPNAEGNVISLQAQVTDAAVEALRPAPRACLSPPPQVLNGIDVLRALAYE